MTDVNFLKQQICDLDERIKNARKIQDWDLVNDLIDCVQVFEEELDVINKAVRYQEDLQRCNDFYDDDKNRDAYTMMIIDKEFSDVVN
jgi:hypothetical protein